DGQLALDLDAYRTQGGKRAPSPTELEREQLQQGDQLARESPAALVHCCVQRDGADGAASQKTGNCDCRRDGGAKHPETKRYGERRGGDAFGGFAPTRPLDIAGQVAPG